MFLTGWSSSSNISAPSTVGTSAQGAWSRGNPIVVTSNHIPVPTQSPAVATGTTPPGGSWAQAAGRGLPPPGIPGVSKSNDEVTTASVAAATAQTVQEDAVTRAINSSDGWGKTPIRQDTAWAIDEPPLRPPETVAPVNEPQSNPQLSMHVLNGTAIWETSASSSGSKAEAIGYNSQRGGSLDAGVATGGSAWTGTPVEKPQDLVSMLNVSGGVPPASFRPPTTPIDRAPPSGSSWPPQSTDRPPTWSGGGDGMWEGSGGSKKDDGPVWNPDSAGMSGRISRPDSAMANWERPSLQRSSSTGSWSGDSDMGGKGLGRGEKLGQEVDDGTACWGDPTGGVSSWRGPDGDKPTMLPPHMSGGLGRDGGNYFGVPPPSMDLKPNAFGSGDHIDGLVGGWNPSVPPVCD